MKLRLPPKYGPCSANSTIVWKHWEYWERESVKSRAQESAKVEQKEGTDPTNFRGAKHHAGAIEPVVAAARESFTGRRTTKPPAAVQAPYFQQTSYVLYFVALASVWLLNSCMSWSFFVFNGCLLCR